jgi:hypothetical protein
MKKMEKKDLYRMMKDEEIREVMSDKIKKKRSVKKLNKLKKKSEMMRINKYDEVIKRKEVMK